MWGTNSQDITHQWVLSNYQAHADLLTLKIMDFKSTFIIISNLVEHATRIRWSSSDSGLYKLPQQQLIWKMTYPCFPLLSALNFIKLRGNLVLPPSLLYRSLLGYCVYMTMGNQNSLGWWHNRVIICVANLMNLINKHFLFVLSYFLKCGWRWSRTAIETSL